MHPDAVSLFEIALLQRGEKLVYYVLFRPIAIHPAEPDQYENHDNTGCDDVPTKAARGRIVLLGIQKGHGVLSIMDSGRVSKVPGTHWRAPQNHDDQAQGGAWVKQSPYSRQHGTNHRNDHSGEHSFNRPGSVEAKDQL